MIVRTADYYGPLGRTERDKEVPGDGLTDAPPSTPAAPQVENTLSGFTSAKVGTF